jgi:hypothetical protein
MDAPSALRSSLQFLVQFSVDHTVAGITAIEF